MHLDGGGDRPGKWSFLGNPYRFRLDGELALITGGGTGIGLAIAPGWIEADMSRKAMDGDPGCRQKI
jgi:hypothetical protein